MDGSQIEHLLVLASAKAAHAHQRLTGQLDFCSAGMKTDAETRGFLTALEFARFDLDSAYDAIVRIEALYQEAK